MNNASLTRRRFALIAAAAASGTPFKLAAQRPNFAASEIVSQINDKSGPAPTGNTVDGFKTGDEGTPVHGVAVAAMATVDVLRQAAKAGLNLVITFEPTFFGIGDGQPPSLSSGTAGGGRPGGPGGRVVAQDDPVLVAKRKLIADSGTVVYRFHDRLLAQRDNGMASALGRALGWSAFTKSPDTTAYTIDPIRLSDLVPHLKERVKANGGIRVVGDRSATVRRVVLLPGLQPLSAITARLPDADLIITGESRDWEGAEYAGDAVAAGMKKSLISIGRVVSEDPGMSACADWMKTFIKTMPVHWIPTGDPFWRPA